MVHDANKLLQGPQSVDPSRHSQQRIRAYRSNRQDAAWPCRVVGGAHEGEPRVIRVTGLIPRAARDAANGLVAALLAPACAVCSALLDAPLSGCVCSNCWRSIRPITPPICDRCGDPLARTSRSLIPSPQPLTPNPQSLVGNPRSLVCAQCRKGVGAVDRARAVGEYEGALREIVHALKYSAPAFAGAPSCRTNAPTWSGAHRGRAMRRACSSALAPRTSTRVSIRRARSRATSGRRSSTPSSGVVRPEPRSSSPPTAAGRMSKVHLDTSGLVSASRM